ncbi:NUDIX domain-containing protein [Cohnella terricola]|uniref:NUDIX domain-containing protein n=1 Tax=Cohnella terricola TaxID=1289167 RepID=A0A559J613_9BACL|nr:NUDIX domain-containing protein [Cohnella terricola]TVX95328.1 NUDIX domain-containing protein [Cohnella terricola]
MRPIRNSAKALIIQDGRVLLTKNKDNDGFFYLFPGGGQEKGEELKDAVVRECIEEIGCRVNVQDLVFVREYIGKNHQFAEWDHDYHQVEFYFECMIEPGEAVGKGTNPDNAQVDVEWIEISKLSDIRIYPAALIEKLAQGSYKPCYIGDTN